MRYLIYVLVLTFFLPLQQVFPQQKQSELMIIPLSKPNQPGSLSIHHFGGSIKVIGYNGSSVIIDVSKETRQESSGKSGLKKINRNVFKLDASEKDNNISLSTNNFNEKTDLDIKVPYRFSLNINVIGNGGIEINNVNGEFVLNCNDGSIHLSNVSGSAVASTLDGDIIARFTNINKDLPMKFTILNGKIDLTVPQELKATFEMRSEFGDILTDINFDLEKSNVEINKSSKKGLTRYSLDSWIKGKMNGGGQRITLKALNGNIYIREDK